MTTVRELCQDALLELGVTDLVDSMDAAKGAFALRMLNRMLQMWDTEGLMVYTLNRDVYNFVAAQQMYTLGTGGNFNVSRPVRIEMASVLYGPSDPNPLEMPIQILTDDEWRAIAVKNVTTPFPTKMWYTGDYPLNKLYFWPIPSTSDHDLVLYTWGKATTFTSLNDSFSMPNGYEEAVVTNLAIMLSNSFGVQPMPVLVQRASISKSNVQRLNNEPLYSVVQDTSPGIASFGKLVDRV